MASSTTLVPPPPLTEVTPLILIDVGAQELFAGLSGQRIDLFVSVSGPEASPVSGSNLRAQIGDGEAGAPEPVFESVQFTGVIWDTYPAMLFGGVIAGHPQYAQASAAFKQTGQSVLPDGLLVTLTVDTMGFVAGETLDLKLASTDIGQNSDFIIVGDQALEPTMTNGTIELVARPGDFNMDSDVDLVDYAVFTDCTAAPGAAPSPSPPLTSQECLDAFDWDDDGDVDVFEFAIFQNAFTGER